VFLRRAQQIIKERHVELEDLDELDQAAVGDVQLAVEVEGARVGVGAVLGNLAIVQIAGQLGRVLVLLVLGLEGADADAVLLGQHHAIDLDLALEHGRDVAVVLQQPLGEDVTAERAQVALDDDRVLGRLGGGLGELLDEHRAQVGRDQLQRVPVHRVLDPRTVVPLPREGADHAVVAARIFLQAALEQAGNRALRRADGSVQQQDAPLGAVAVGGRFERVDELHQSAIEPVDGIVVAGGELVEELVANDLFLVLVRLLGAVRQDHVVQALVGVAGDLGVGADDVEVLFERTLPVDLGILAQVELVAQSAVGTMPRGIARCLAGQGSRRLCFPLRSPKPAECLTCLL